MMLLSFEEFKAIVEDYDVSSVKAWGKACIWGGRLGTRRWAAGKYQGSSSRAATVCLLPGLLRQSLVCVIDEKRGEGDSEPGCCLCLRVCWPPQ